MYYVAPSVSTVVRWGARLLSAVILLFWGFFLVAQLVGDEGRSSRPLTWDDYLGLAALVAALVGLALAWKWELTGAAVTLVAVAVCAAANWKILLFPGLLIPLTAALYLCSWWARRAPRGEAAA